MSQRPKVIRKIEDVRVKQIYENSNAFEMGKTTIEYDGVDVTIYNVEEFKCKKRKQIEQEEYCFDIAYDEGASLLINSNE